MAWEERSIHSHFWIGLFQIINVDVEVELHSFVVVCVSEDEVVSIFDALPFFLQSECRADLKLTVIVSFLFDCHFCASIFLCD